MFLLVGSINYAWSQDSSKLVLSGYAEVYYGYDFSNPSNHERPSFVYNHKRHNEVNLNLAYVKAAYTSAKVRSNLALMVGNYAQNNLAAEPSLLQQVLEANIGVKVSKKHNLWLDAGVMPSHIGFESAISADCWTNSRSMAAEGSPYFETGAKLSLTNKKENLTAAVLLLNGWQRIQRPDGVQRPSVGMQINYKPASNLTLNYSNFIGSDQPDSLGVVRMFHDFYMIYEPNNKWGIIAGFDLGKDFIEDRENGFWYTPIIVVRRTLNAHSKLALRGEYYNDANENIFATGTKNGFQTSGLSLNYDYSINSNAMFRIEGKSFFSKDPIFDGGREDNNFALLASLNVRF